MDISLPLVLLLSGLLVTAVAAFVASMVALRRSRPGHARRISARRRVGQVPADVEGLRNEVQALRLEVSDALRHLAVVRYDAFGDMGGHLSWSMALLDDGGSGVVLTSIHGRSEARTYAKNITAWKCDQALSPEEEEAVKFAKTS
ncbi:MAG TPA: DUF4446 family protein [Nocardioidaceae bacterium]|nr:DUF4446 family protein [Nocardioidaceae bacterium]